MQEIVHCQNILKSNPSISRLFSLDSDLVLSKITYMLQFMTKPSVNDNMMKLKSKQEEIILYAERKHHAIISDLKSNKGSLNRFSGWKETLLNKTEHVLKQLRDEINQVGMLFLSVY